MVERDSGSPPKNQKKIEFPLSELRTDTALGAGGILFVVNTVGPLLGKAAGAPPGSLTTNALGNLVMAGLGAGVGILYGLNMGRSYSDYLIGDKSLSIRRLVQAERSVRDRLLSEQAREIFIVGGFDNANYNNRERRFFDKLQSRLSSHTLHYRDIRKGRSILRRQGIVFDSP